MLLASGGVLLREHALYMFVTAAAAAPDVSSTPTRIISIRAACVDILSSSRATLLNYNVARVIWGRCVLLRGIDFDARTLQLGDGQGPSSALHR